MKPKQAPDSPPFDGFKPPEYTQIPNTLLDDLMRVMECSELKVTLAICRQTLGWHKKEDELSLSQLKAMTGLSRQSVITGIEDGMKRGVIRRRPKGQGYMYRIHLVQSLDQLSATNGTEPPKSLQLVQSLDQPPPVASPIVRPELVQSLDTQKKGKKESGGDGGRTLAFLIDMGIGAAAEFAHLPFEPTKQDYYNRKADNAQSNAMIVKAWRANPPTKDYHYEQSRPPIPSNPDPGRNGTGSAHGRADRAAATRAPRPGEPAYYQNRAPARVDRTPDEE